MALKKYFCLSEKRASCKQYGITTTGEKNVLVQSKKKTHCLIALLRDLGYWNPTKARSDDDRSKATDVNICTEYKSHLM